MSLKNICATFMVAIMALGMPTLAVGEGENAAPQMRQSVEINESHPAVGVWQLDAYSNSDEEYSDDDIRNLGERFELAADGSALHTIDGETTEGKWSDEGGQILLDAGETHYVLNFDGNVLSMDDGKTSMRFVRDTSSLNQLSYSAAESENMCNLMNGGLFAMDGNTLFGLAWDESGKAMLAARALNSDESVAGEAQMLDSGCIAEYINVVDGTLYYVRTADNEPGIYSMRPDGSARTQILSGVFCSLQIFDGRMYYTDNENRLYSCMLDGIDSVNVMDGEVYYPYVMSTDWIIYQNSADNESLHAFRPSDGYDISLSDERSLLPVLIGNQLYYFEKPYAEDDDKAERANICRVDMTTLERSAAVGFSGAYLAVNGESMFAADGYRLNDVNAWWTIENSAYAGAQKAPVFANDDYLVSLLYDAGAIDSIEIERLSDGQAVSCN